MAEGALKLPLDIEQIKTILPHRSPFLLVDRIVELESDRRVVGVKNVTSNERYFIAGPGGRPVLPASILTEAMAQAGAVLILSKPENRSRLVYFMGIDRAKFRKPVLPGDQIHYHVRKVRNRGRVWRFFGEAKVNGAVVAEAEVSAMLADTAEAKAFASSLGK